jgi:FlaA1/EpsC-like NDP-sugar epimerase
MVGSLTDRRQRVASQLNNQPIQGWSIVKRWLFHRNVQIALDGAVAGLALIAAYELRFDFQIPLSQRGSMWVWVYIFVFIQPSIIFLTQGYGGTWRFFNLGDALYLGLRSFPTTVIALIIRGCAHRFVTLSYSVIILELGIFVACASSLRVLRRLTHERLYRKYGRPRALIIGSESTLAPAVRHIQSCGEAHVVALVSENAKLVGLHVLGVPVVGSPESLPALLAANKIELVILSGADLECAGHAIQSSINFDVQVRILPSLGDWMGDRVRVSRTVGIEHIVQSRKEENGPTHSSVVECFRGRTVLVTGAGGSIGSEIAKQVSSLDINRLIVLDHDENSIFELMNKFGSDLRKNIVPVIGNIRDRDVVRRIFENYRPEVVLHAAAYKHVPVMEENCCEAVLNNICGTRELADAAIDFGCGRVVMISTDKAVRPSSVMGATKRVAEMVVQQRAAESGKLAAQTHFACVRFGNVLGSRGSVVPIFLRQIAAGGPVTITHEQMTRYFMTIPQAVQLVLEATTLASSGDIYMLDMGDPVKIIDFAKDIIKMSGLTPGKDIEIKIVGTRPGEKLHEQLWNDDAQVTATRFSRVSQVKAVPVPADFSQQLGELISAAKSRSSDKRICALLRELPIEYGHAALEEAAQLTAVN